MSDIVRDFGWGNPYFLLEILDNTYHQRLAPFNIKDMIYCPDLGMDKLIEVTHKMIEETMGLKYDNIIITTGATQAANILLRVLKNDKINTVVTPPYGFPYYGDMVEKAGYVRVSNIHSLVNFNPSSIKLIDSPSNPQGIQYGSAFGSNLNTIWDSVYHNKIYTTNLSTIPKHRAMVGSYSKLLGITGVRIGFIATNYHALAKRCAQECLMENATISVPSQELIIDIMDKIDLDHFLTAGKNSIDLNREEFRKIEYLFDNQPVPETGMFYCAFADKKALEILEKCGIKYVDLGDSYIRLSLGQTNEITREAIAAILKEDKKWAEIQKLKKEQLVLKEV